MLCPQMLIALSALNEPAWLPYAIDFAHCRQAIKRIVQHESGKSESGSGAKLPYRHQSSQPMDQPMSMESDAVAQPAVAATSDSSSHAAHERFWQLLSQNVSRVEGLYLRQASELSLMLHQRLGLERLFDSAEATSSIAREHEQYVSVVHARWRTQIQSHRPANESFQPLPPAPGSLNYNSFVATLWPSLTLSPQTSLMFLQALKEGQPEVGSSVALHASQLLPELLGLVQYSPEPATLDLMRHLLAVITQIDKLQRFVAINVAALIKLLKAYG